MKHRMLTILLLGALMLALAAAGLAQDSAVVWDRDMNQHWINSASGERIDAAPHTIEDDIFCTICGSEIWRYEDGTADVSNYNPFGDLMRYTAYDSTGAAFNDYYYVCTYTEDGVKQREQIYFFSTLVEDTSYRISLLGDCVPMLQCGWNDDGTSSQNEYDEYGSVIRMSTYAADGSLLFEELSEYEYGEDGVILSATAKGRFAEGESYTSVTNQYGDNTYSAHYNADGSVIMETRTEIEYDEYGSKIHAKHYMDGALLSESIYEVVNDEYGSWSREKTYIEYNDDGTRLVYAYDESGEEISVTLQDADGKAIGDGSAMQDAGTDEALWADDTSLEPSEGGAYLIED